MRRRRKTSLARDHKNFLENVISGGYVPDPDEVETVTQEVISGVDLSIQKSSEEDPTNITVSTRDGTTVSITEGIAKTQKEIDFLMAGNTPEDLMIARGNGMLEAKTSGDEFFGSDDDLESLDLKTDSGTEYQIIKVQSDTENEPGSSKERKSGEEENILKKSGEEEDILKKSSEDILSVVERINKRVSENTLHKPIEKDDIDECPEDPDMDPVGDNSLTDHEEVKNQPGDGKGIGTLPRDSQYQTK